MPTFFSGAHFSKIDLLGRKTKDYKFCIWNWDKKDSILKEISKRKDCKLLTHAEAIKEMETDQWISKEKELQEIQS